MLAKSSQKDTQCSILIMEMATQYFRT